MKFLAPFCCFLLICVQNLLNQNRAFIYLSKVFRHSSCQIRKLVETHEAIQFLQHSKDSPREKCPNTEFFLVRIFPCSGRIQEKADQKISVFGIYGLTASLDDDDDELFMRSGSPTKGV